nr:response regulator [uncultured Cohaesibacter sp.]
MPHALERITYAEDEPDIRAITELALASIGGYTLDLCENGKQVLESVETFKPNLILLDVMMPVMDGVETLQHLKANPATATIPVIVMTAKAQKHEIESYKQKGAVDVVTKPFDPISLSFKIHSIWANYTASMEIAS